MRSSAQRTVLDLVRHGHARTRGDLSTLIGMSRSAVAQTVAELVAEGLLAEHAAVRREGRGRPSSHLRVVRRQGWVAGLDLGHRHVGVALGDLHHHVLDERRVRWPVDDSATAALTLARTMLLDALARHGLRHDDLRAVGLGVPFPVVAGVVRPVGTVPGWDGVRPRELLSGLPATLLVDNASSLAAWGEFVALRSPDVRSLLYVSAGDGVGGGLVIDGAMYGGRRGITGEVGHVAVPGCTVRCRCGRVGCLDALVTAAARGTAEDLRAAAEALGVLLAGLASFVDPDAVVLGGVLPGARPELVTAVERAYREAEPLRHSTFGVARLGPRSPLWGAFDRATQEAWARA